MMMVVVISSWRDNGSYDKYEYKFVLSPPSGAFDFVSSQFSDGCVKTADEV